ncbi:protein kinase [Kribbella sp. NPDC026611]|uniref:serine/threonine-protein kinase n=1 Tax=Kribbella sp. NPDC026611 TaxID=3154911 RepID=UPI0033D2EB10
MTERPVTRHESADDRARPVTRHESERTGAPVTRHEGDEASVGRHVSRARLIPPPEVDARYEYVRELSSGGAQADVVLFRDRSNGQEVAIKIYRPDASKVLDQDAIKPLESADTDHVLEFTLHSDDFQVWEVQEYLPLGSLEDLVNRRGAGPQAPEFVLDVLKEIGQALDHVHALGVSHRDLKPQNILIRRETPLDCVLADFGLARMGVLSNAIGSVAGTYIYTSPEGSVGRGNKANDWWGLGVIVHELLTGRHLHAIPGGDGVLSEVRVRAAYFEQSWSYDEVTDPRWKLLLDGLLSPAEGRWVWAQVTEWIAGGSPAITAHWPNRTPISRRRARKSYHFAGVQCTEPAELARAIRENFTVARDHLAGVRVSDLRAWLHETPVGDEADGILDAVRSGATSPGRAAVELQLLLDPEHEPSFRGRELSGAELTKTIRAALKGDAAAVEWVHELRSSSVLSVVGQHAEEPLLSRADDLLAMWWRRIDTGLLQTGFWAQPEVRKLVTDAVPRLEGTLLDAALSDEKRKMVWSRARELLSDRRSVERTDQLKVSISRELNLENFVEAAVVTLVFPSWFEEVESRQSAAAAKAKAERDAARKAAQAESKAERERQKEAIRRDQGLRIQRRRTKDKIAIGIGVATCATVVLPWLVGRYLLRGRWPRYNYSAVYDVDARRAGAYFLSDWLSGCMVVAVLVAAYLVLRPWRQRVGTIVATALGLGAIWYWGVPYVQAQWQKQEDTTVALLSSTPYPFEDKYYTCGSATLTGRRINAAGYVESYSYSMFTGRTKGSTTQACNLIEVYDGWQRIKRFDLRAKQYVDSNTFSSPVTVTENRPPEKAVFTVQTRSGKLTYKLSALLAR